MNRYSYKEYIERLIYMAPASGDYFHVRLVIAGGGKVKVLVAGESTGFHVDLYEMLYALDFVRAVYQAECEEEAAEKLRAERVGVMILNTGLKSGNWVRLLINTKKEKEATTIIMLGDRAHPIVQLLCIALGADLFLDTAREAYRIPGILSELDGSSMVRNIA